MGCSQSNTAYSALSGTESDYKAAFDEVKTLGEGQNFVQFGLVKLVVKKDSKSQPFAVKVLGKGFTFKDNILYTPMKPGVLKMELDILQVLQGKNYNLALDSIYESSSKVYVVTELCEGGEMLEYTSKNMAEGLRMEDVSRIAYQLLSALDHCDRHNILHRDLKPQNIIPPPSLHTRFKANTKTAELRVIDFGCGIMDDSKGKEHATFAGTPFLISPEVFQKKYTSKTDIFSAGVVLYVLVAGYPENLDYAFDILHSANRDLKTLPGMPKDMPDTFYEMLDKMLLHDWRGRNSAAEMLRDEFVAFYHALVGNGPNRVKMRRTSSMILSGTGEKAALAFGSLNFQRSVTTIMASMMSKTDLLTLLSAVEKKTSSSGNVENKLAVIKVVDLRSILEAMVKTDCLDAIARQNNAHIYDNYSYEYKRLEPFTMDNPTTTADILDSGASSAPRKLQFSTRMLNASTNMGGSSKRLSRKSQSVYIRGT
ncbi:hypothetical protein ACHAW5_002719 [Stephanodiscus triporus]|uniref:Protein kinase domain-containing protein n=1 Tax=Stephanodiscus triporus TaxID=2934178 RepID=A0ABD3MIN3_9STRA